MGRAVLAANHLPLTRCLQCGGLHLRLAMQGMLQLHTHRPQILHRDLKSPNLVVDKHWRVKARSHCSPQS